MKTRSRIYKNYNKDEEINLSIPNMPIVNIPVANIKTAKETVPYDNININEPFPRKSFTIVETKEYKNLNYKKIIFFFWINYIWTHCWINNIYYIIRY